MRALQWDGEDFVTVIEETENYIKNIQHQGDKIEDCIWYVNREFYYRLIKEIEDSYMFIYHSHNYQSDLQYRGLTIKCYELM